MKLMILTISRVYVALIVIADVAGTSIVVH